jgi:hypothetical protein
MISDVRARESKLDFTAPTIRSFALNSGSSKLHQAVRVCSAVEIQMPSLQVLTKSSPALRRRPVAQSAGLAR